MDHGPVCARVNNKVQGMHYRLYNDKDVEFLDMRSGSGSRTYTRTLFYTICKRPVTVYIWVIVERTSDKITCI